MESKVFLNAVKLIFPRKKFLVENLKLITPQTFPATAQMRLVKQLGRGSYATVYMVEENVSGQQYAVRVLKTSSIARHTIATQLILANYSMSPRIYYIVTINVPEARGRMEEYSVVFMDYIMGTLDSLIESNVDFSESMKCLMDKKYLLNFLHGDMHTENIAVLKDGKTLGFIDFDFSYFGVPQDLNFLDFIPLLGSLKPVKSPNARALENALIDYYKEKFNITIDIKLVKKKRTGGYDYAGSLTSYVVMDRSFIPQIKILFPDFRLPKIIP